jgi:hypothetical protein
MKNSQQGITVQVYQARLIIGEVKKPLTKAIAMQFPVQHKTVPALRLFETRGLRPPYGKVLGRTLKATPQFNGRLRPEDFRYVNYDDIWFLLIDDAEAGLVWQAYKNPEVDDEVYPKGESFDQPMPMRPGGRPTYPVTNDEDYQSDVADYDRKMAEWERSPEYLAYQTARNQWEADRTQWQQEHDEWWKEWWEVEWEHLTQVPTLVL